jgi:hypothetical protein
VPADSRQSTRPRASPWIVPRRRQPAAHGTGRPRRGRAEACRPAMEDPAMSSADEAALDRRRKLELWKAQKEAEKATKGQVRGAPCPAARCPACRAPRAPRAPPLRRARAALCSVSCGARKPVGTASHTCTPRAPGQLLCPAAARARARVACLPF